MKRIGLYITGSFFLMTLSAAAETWFSSAAKGYSVFFPSIELLNILFPLATGALETIVREYSPLVWEVLIATLFQLPLWSIFAILASIFSYILMTDSSAREISGNNSKAFDIWTTITPYDDEGDPKLGSLINRRIEETIKKPALGAPEIWNPSFPLEGNTLETDRKRPISSYEIPDFKLSQEDTVINSDDEIIVRKAGFDSKASIHVAPDVWNPAPPSAQELGDFDGKKDFYGQEKFEIDDLVYEFDKLNEFLSYNDLKPNDD